MSTEKFVTLTSKTIKQLINEGEVDKDDNKYSKTYRVGDYPTNIHISVDNTQDKDKNKLVFTGKLRLDGKSFNIDEKSCRLATELIDEHLATREIPSAEDITNAKEKRKAKQLEDFFQGIDMMLTVLTDERFNQVVDHLVPRVGELVGKFIGNLAGSIEVSMEESKKAYKARSRNKDAAELVNEDDVENQTKQRCPDKRSNRGNSTSTR